MCLSRTFLRLLEHHLPDHLATHYALVFEGEEPVAAVAAQSLDIRVASLPGRSEEGERPGLWRALGKAARTTLAKAGEGVLLYDNFLVGSLHPEPKMVPADPGTWPAVGSALGCQFRHLLLSAERLAEASVGWARLRFLVCGNLLSMGPYGVALAQGEDPARLWPAVLEALARIRRSDSRFGGSGMVLIKDLTPAECPVEGVLQEAGFQRFATEPNMVLDLRPDWTSFQAYLQDLKSSYRSSVQRTFRDLEESGIVLEVLGPDEVQAESATIHQLYRQVHDHQRFRLATLGPDWIPALARTYPADSRLLAARSRRDGRMLGFVAMLRDGQQAIGTYIGFDKAEAANGAPLYLALVSGCVAQAIELKTSSLSMGRTALYPKAQLGAKPQPMFGYLRHWSPALNLAVPGILAMLPEPAQAPLRHPFRHEAGEDA